MSLRAYADRLRETFPRVMGGSRARVVEGIKAGTPVKTGHMRDALQDEGDDAGYEAFWQAEDFPAGEFYPVEVILEAGKDPLTPAIESERALLPRDLATVARQASARLQR